MKVENGILTEVTDDDIHNGQFDFPPGVREIGPEAFQFCRSLKEINIPPTVTRIAEKAFYYCTGLTVINIPGNVTHLGAWGLCGCYNITKIKLNEGLTHIGDYAIVDLNIESLLIPKSVTHFGVRPISNNDVYLTISIDAPIGSKDYNRLNALILSQLDDGFYGVVTPNPDAGLDGKIKNRKQYPHSFFKDAPPELVHYLSNRTARDPLPTNDSFWVETHPGLQRR